MAANLSIDAERGTSRRSGVQADLPNISVGRGAEKVHQLTEEDEGPSRHAIKQHGGGDLVAFSYVHNFLFVDSVLAVLGLTAMQAFL